MNIEPISFGIGDRFGREGRAQLQAIIDINRRGTPVVPVWNKSNREHQLTGTTQESVRTEADQAVGTLQWTENYYVDADHITIETVDSFLEYSDFFTLDVAAFIGMPANPVHKADFLRRNAGHDPDYDLESFASRYLSAIGAVKELYDHICSKKPGGFITEVSMDEVPEAQKPEDIYHILKELKYLNIEPHTIAPKFTGLFPKGVDYIGDVELFAAEFERDLVVLNRVSKEFDFGHTIKLSIHSGSDKFSLYPVIRRLIGKYGAGIHVKTAGTTWLEEVAGLVRGGGEGVRLAKEIYIRGLQRFDELAAPYASVLHITPALLPSGKEVMGWSPARFANTLIHDSTCRDYNPNVRQLIHISYKIAAEMGLEFLDALTHYRDSIEEQVYNNLYHKHLLRLF